MLINRLDHLVLTVKNIEETVAFYVTVLGMEKQVFGKDRVALKFGTQKINLHEAGREFEPKAFRPTRGSADLCFITETPLQQALDEVREHGVDIIDGPVLRTGATGRIESFYFRDPDENLIEISRYIEG